MRHIVQTVPEDHTACGVAVVSTVLQPLRTLAPLYDVNLDSPLSSVILAPLVYLNISCYYGSFGSRQWNTSLIESHLSPKPQSVMLELLRAAR